jgi:hypothetical protein
MGVRLGGVVRVVPKADRRAGVAPHAAFAAFASARRSQLDSRFEFGNQPDLQPAALVWLTIGGSIGLIALAFLAALG